MPHRFTSLRHPLEKLLEAEYFLVRLTRSGELEFQFHLNAFLSASRSVTLVLQKAFANVSGFQIWYKECQSRMKADAAMAFFVELRNISQKEGPVSFVGGSHLSERWIYRFVGRQQAVPEELQGRDIDLCCLDYLVKLANVLLDCMNTFPFDSCPARAFTEEGMEKLGYDWRDVEAALGLSSGYTNVDIPTSAKLRILSNEIEPLDAETIVRLSSSKFYDGEKRLQLSPSNDPFIDFVAETMEANDGKADPWNAIRQAILKTNL